MASGSPSVYFILGTPGSGRRGIVRDLIENGLGTEDRALVLVRLDRRDEARAALAPFAAGTVDGGYRQREAIALRAALASKP